MSIVVFLRNTWSKYKLEIAALIIASMVLQTDYTLVPNVSLDGSWIRAINMAIHNGLVFGKDFIFTYGPLGFIDTRYEEYLPKGTIFFFDMFLLFGYYRMFKEMIKGNKDILLFLFLSMIFIRFSFFSYATKLFLCYLFFIMTGYRREYRDYTGLVFISLTACILFFDKINFGLIAVAIAVFPLTVCLLRNRKGAIILLATFLVSFFIVFHFSHIDIWGYVRHSIPLISSYNDAMYLHVWADNKFILLAFADVFFTIALLVFLWRDAGQNKSFVEKVLISLLTLLFAFLDFKNGFVRADYHIVFFFYYFPLFLCIMTWETGLWDGGYFKWQVKASLVITFVAFFAFQFDSINLYKTLIKIVIPYSRSMFSNKDEEIVRNGRIYLPQKILNEIKGSSVDIFPYEISIAQCNGLNYKPRPIPQSYVAFTREFDSLNASFISGKNKPDYLIFSNKSIDDRNPIWDESITKAAVRLNYHYVCSFQLLGRNAGPTKLDNSGVMDTSGNDYYFLLKANDKEKGIEPVFEKTEEFSFDFGDTKRLDLPDSVPVYMTASIAYNPFGKASRLLFQPPQLSMTMTFEDGYNVTLRCIHSTLSTPLLINKNVLSNTGLINFFTGNIRADKNVKSIRFVPEYGWDKKIKISLYRMVNYR